MTARVQPLVMARALFFAAGIIAGYLATRAPEPTPPPAPHLVDPSAKPFWLVAVSDSATVVGTFATSPECVAASVAHNKADGARFAACFPSNADAEAQHVEYLAYEYGLIDGDF